jgi:hypothetical protein
MPADKIDLSDTSLDADRVLMKIMSAYMAGMKRCYRDELKVDPTAQGKIVLELTVGENGRISSATATGFEAGVSSCVQTQMAAWRFPVPKAADGSATTAAFRLSFMFVPE